MPDRLNTYGLKTKDLPEIREEIKEGFKRIYGEDVNLEQNTPDGQNINIFAQSAADNRELVQNTFSSFDPDQASGRILDQRVAINGIMRKGASYTIVAINISVDREVELVGLDSHFLEIEPSIKNLFTVKDNIGNQYFLIESQTLGVDTVAEDVDVDDTQPEENPEQDTAAEYKKAYKDALRAYQLDQEQYNKALTDLYNEFGAWKYNKFDEEGGAYNPNYVLPTPVVKPSILSRPLEQYVKESLEESGEDVNTEDRPTQTYALYFRAEDIGQVETTTNTINQAVTILAGVVDINNPEYGNKYIQGQNEETDAQLKIRRRLSVAIPSVGVLEGIRGNLLAQDGVVSAYIYENDGNVTDAATIPPHSIWTIVEGGKDSDIAEVLYRTKTAGTGMYGQESYSIDRKYGLPFVAKFDRPIDQKLFIRFTASIILERGTTAPNLQEDDKAHIISQIVKGMSWDVGQRVGADDIIQFIKENNPKIRVSKLSLATLKGELDEGITTLKPTRLNMRFRTGTGRIQIIDGNEVL